jgi:predicted O-methyltransferase YrrM
MERPGPSSSGPVDHQENPSSGGDAVPVGRTALRQPILMSPAARKSIRHRMLLLRHSSLEHLERLTAVPPADLKQYRRELTESDLPETLLNRGAGLAFTRELPQGSLLYLLVRALKPRRVVETGVRPGYSTAWLLSALDANGSGDLVSLGPGPTTGRGAGVHEVVIGQFVAPKLRTRWTLALGNTVENLQGILAQGPATDLFFYDNGPDVNRARIELRSAWNGLSDRGVLLAHHIDLNPAFEEFCRAQGIPAAPPFDAGPPPMGAISMRNDGAAGA